MSTKKKTPVQTHNPARLLRMGTCEVTRVEGPTEGTETLCIQLFPYSWKYPVTVDLGDTDLEPFAPGTPWKEILRTAVETEFSFLGKTFHACLRCAKYPDFGSEGVELALHTTFTKNVKSGIGVATKPFAVWSIEAWNEEKKVKAEKDDAMRKTARTVLGVGGKPCIGLVIGGTPMNIGKRSFGNIAKISPEPKGRKDAAKELYDSMYDALVNCDEKWIDVVAYKADTSNPVSFRITDEDDHNEDVLDLKFQLIDGIIDVVNIKPSRCIETTYAIVPVDGDM